MPGTQNQDQNKANYEDRDLADDAVQGSGWAGDGVLEEAGEGSNRRRGEASEARQQRAAGSGGQLNWPF